MRNLPSRYVTAANEARRFLARMDELQRRANDDEAFFRYIDITGGKETAAVKRASLDLTRALADLRR